MKSSLKYAVLVMFAIMAQHKVFAQNRFEFSLEESIRFALENNVEVKNAILDNAAAKATIAETRSEGLPQINIDAGASHNMIIPITPLPSELVEGAPPGEFVGVQFSPAYLANVTGTVRQMIFNGSYFVGLQAAKTFRELSDFDRVKTEIDVVESVKKAYYSVLVNEEREGLINSNKVRIEALLKETNVLFEEGFAERIDVSRIKVQLNNLKTELDRARTATDVSKQLLKLQMGMPMNAELILEDKVSVLEDDFEIEVLLQEQGQRRIELDQVETTLKLANLDLRNNRAQYLPRLDANYTYQRNTFGGSVADLTRNNWFPGSILGVTLQIPVFDGLLKASRIQQNKIQVRQLENQREFTRDNIELERFQSRANLINSLNALEVQRENRELAEEVFNIARIKFQEGVGSNLEVVDADAALKEAETNYYSALYDAVIAKVDLEKALGILK
ncbi:TolC family protein [Litoribacter ruber]|uniref:TolC family protein n=1 Tax=Litoribacter ruber TaxID=702568 RepID=A0AAP2CGW9_9BACT|nr:MULTISPECIES: TolC family protein [Litoribacter]MBS9522986.1 TolC family protein [Litoribacter alkaliphilus]MBT0810850.1 TolC family protein [Litoribacter ruber]